MSADANSAYGKPWFRRTSNPSDPAQNTNTATLNNTSSHEVQPTSAQSLSSAGAPVASTRASTQVASGGSAFMTVAASSDATDTSGARAFAPRNVGTYPNLANTESTPTSIPVLTPAGAAKPSAGVQAVATEAAWEESQPVTQLSRLLAGAQTRMHQALSDQVTPLRLASHLSVLLVAAAVLLFSRIQIPEWDFQLVTMPEEQAQEREFGSVAAQMSKLLSVTPMASSATVAANSLQVQIVPFTIIPERTRKEIQVYSVQSGDTMFGIAAKFKVQPETLLWANPALESNPDQLRISDQLNILPVDGVLHTVKAGDSLSALSSTYKVDAAQIVAYEANNLESVNSPLIIGTDIVVPGGSKPYVTREVAGMGLSSVPVPAGAAGGSGNFNWPASGSISQNYWGGHQAIDVAGRQGAPVKAADGGFVTVAGGGWNGGYGNQVVIDHGNGFVTLYAHLNSIFVKAGETVSAGQQVGTVGNTGNSTGPHLHFEIRYQGYPRDPYNYLP